MNPWIQRLVSFYTDHRELTIVLVAMVGGWLLSKVIPEVSKALVRMFRSVTRKLGGKFAFRSIQDAYLNWVVLQNQDLNLTGVVGSGEKPKLEQVFIALKVVRGSSYQVGDEVTKDMKVVRGAVLKRILDSLIRWWTVPLGRVFAGSPRVKTDQEASREPTTAVPLFQPSSYWRLRRFFERDWVDATGIILLVLVFYLFAIYGLYLTPTINNPAAFFGTAICITWVLAGVMEWKDNRSVAVGCFVAGTGMLLLGAVVWRILIAHQSPLAVLGGAVFAVFGIVVLARTPRGDSRGHEPDELAAREIGRLLASEDTLAILGGPGAGKSTYVQFLALTFAQERAGERKLRKPGVVKKRLGISRWRVPILIPLRMVPSLASKSTADREGMLLIEAFREHVLPSGIRAVFSTSYILHKLRRRQCLLLLDGLDEVVDDVQFRVVVKEILGLVSRFPGNKVIVTSRYAGWRGGLGSSFRLFEVQDLSHEQAEGFIKRWYHAIEDNRAPFGAKAESPAEKLHRERRADDNASRLAQAFRQVESIRRLAKNPLLLSIICFVHYHKTLPKERLSLYQDCSNLLLVQWDREKGLIVDDTRLSLAWKEAIMQQIAFAMHCGRIGSRFDRREAAGEEIIPIVEEMLVRFQMDPSQASSLFQKLVDRSGIMVVVEQVSGRYAFSHLTFQEFYAAKYLHENHLDIFDAIAQVSEEATDVLTGWWREVVLLYAAMQRNPSRIIEELCHGHDEDLFRRRTQLAAQCLAESVEVPGPQLEAAIIDSLFRIRTGEPLSTVNMVLPREVRNYLLRFAAGTSFHKYALCGSISLLLEKSSPASADALLLPLSKSADRDVQVFSLRTIARLCREHGVSQAVDTEILENLLSDTDSELRIVAVETVAWALPRPVSQELIRRTAETLLEGERLVVESSRYDPISGARLMRTGVPFIAASATDDTLDTVLREASRSLSGQDLDKLRRSILEVLRSFLLHDRDSFDIALQQSTPRICRDRFWVAERIACLYAGLIRLDNAEQKADHRRQLSAMLDKGTAGQQARALLLLSEITESPAELVQIVLPKLGSPSSIVRIAGVRAVRRLKVPLDDFEPLKDALRQGLVKDSQGQRTKHLGAEIAIGKGRLGLSLKEHVEVATTLAASRETRDADALMS